MEGTVLLIRLKLCVCYLLYHTLTFCSSQRLHRIEISLMRKRHCKTKQCRAPVLKLLLLLISDTNNGRDTMLLHKSFPFQWISAQQQDNIYVFACSISSWSANITSKQQLSKKKKSSGEATKRKIFLAAREKTGGLNSNISHLVWKDGSRNCAEWTKITPIQFSRPNYFGSN